MKSEELSKFIKSKIGNILGYPTISEAYLAEHLGTNVKMIKRMRKGKIPPKYEREVVLDRLRRTWVHWEGYSNELATLELRS